MQDFVHQPYVNVKLGIERGGSWSPRACCGAGGGHPKSSAMANQALLVYGIYHYGLLDLKGTLNYP